MSQYTEEDVRQTIYSIVIDMAPEQGRVGQEELVLVDDLGYHSLALLELAFALEDEYGLPPIDQENAQCIRTLADVQDYVLSQLRLPTDAGETA